MPIVHYMSTGRVRPRKLWGGRRANLPLRFYGRFADNSRSIVKRVEGRCHARRGALLVHLRPLSILLGGVVREDPSRGRGTTDEVHQSTGPHGRMACRYTSLTRGRTPPSFLRVGK